MRVPIRKPGKYTHNKSDFLITPKKLEQYKTELERIKKISRPKAMQEVKRLSEMGDFSENTEYQIAKGRLRGLNSRIDKLEEAIKKVKIISTEVSSDIVRIGSSVIIELDNQNKEYLILGSAESDPINGVISHTSPLGSALVGKTLGASFKVLIADKEVQCQIKEIK